MTTEQQPIGDHIAWMVETLRLHGATGLQGDVAGEASSRAARIPFSAITRAVEIAGHTGRSTGITDLYRMWLNSHSQQLYSSNAKS